MPDFSMTLRLDADVANNLKQLSELTNKSLASITRDAVKSYVTERLTNELFEAQTLESLQQYRETGLHVTLDELSPWLLGESNKLPTCHK